MKKQAILITSNFSNTTGFAWKFFFRLFNVIANKFYSNNIRICLSFAKIVEPVKILDDNLPFHSFCFDPINITIRGILHLRRNIIKQNIKYGYFTDFSSWHWLYLLIRVWGVKKIIVHTHTSVPAPYPPPSEKGIKKAVKTIIHRIKIFSPDAVYACSEFVKDRFVRVGCYPINKIKVINHGIDIHRFDCPPSDVIQKKIIVIFTVARATKYKGINVLIEAARIIRDKHNMKDFIVKYGGNGPDLDEFKRTVFKYKLGDHFKFLGELEDTRENTCNADIVVVPSCWGDAYPLSVIEAMSAGKPIIATDVGGIPEEIGNDECGILIKPNDSDALAEQLVGLMRDESRRLLLGKNARKRAEKLLNEDRFFDEVLDNLMRDVGFENWS